MVKKFWNNLDKTARGNCVCLMIAMTILCAIAFKNQNACRVSDAPPKSGSVRAFMINHMFPCDVSGRTPFRPPSELSQYVGDVPNPRTMGTMPAGARYKIEQQRKDLAAQQY
jgi:hypothetical protein